MRISDSHIHTKFSPDADQKACFSDYIEKAMELGLPSITFTDHFDIDAVHPLFKEQLDVENYIKEFNQTQKKYNYQTTLGIEVGYQPHVKEDINTFLMRNPFDFIILSIHYIDKQDLYTQEYFHGKSKEEAYKRYFDLCLEAIKNIDNFTVFGHLDYITRYSPFGDYEYEKYKEKIDLILLELIKRNKGIEINTSGIKHEKRFYPKEEVVKRFIQLGGNIITFGSDAHHIEELGRGFNNIPTYFSKYIHQ